MKKLNDCLLKAPPFIPSTKKQALICLNDLGNLDRWSSYSPLFEIIYDPYLPTRHPDSARDHWIDIESFIQITLIGTSLEQ